MNNFFDNQRILDAIWRRKFHFIVVGVIAIVLSGIFSGPSFITPKFKSTARIYPTSNVAVFSEESRTEQMLEILISNDIKLRMFDAFRLDTVYKVPKEDPHYMTMMLDMYGNNVNASKTQFETVQIEVIDQDPVRASNMCDSIIHFYNEKIGSIHALKHLEMYKIADDFQQDKLVELDSVTTLLQNVREETGVTSFGRQLERITEGYMLALAENNGQTSNGREIKQYWDNLRNQGNELYVLESQFRHASRSVDSLARIKEVALLEANKDITYSHIVEYPRPADKKSYPVRWLIVAFSTVSAVFLALLVFLILDYRKNY